MGYLLMNGTYRWLIALDHEVAMEDRQACDGEASATKQF